MGTRESFETSIEGRITFDAMVFLIKLGEKKLSSYTLNSVCEEYLKERKVFLFFFFSLFSFHGKILKSGMGVKKQEDVPHTQISVLQNGTDADRGKLAKYCFKDSKLPVMLMNKLSMFHTVSELSRVTGIPFSYVMSRGQQVFSPTFSWLFPRKTKQKKTKNTRKYVTTTGSRHNTNYAYHACSWNQVAVHSIWKRR